MSYIHKLQGNQRLLFREEGRIKSYESCVDVRSWSHDSERRSRYLHEWMKSEMPIRVVPGHKLAVFFNNMTCRSRRKVAPKCHADCKSKLVLESICNSCSAMKGCLKNDNNFSTIFQEEDFDTCYWPCERCLEVLKNIKMFWKIILDKLLNIKISKPGEFGDNSHKVHRADTVHSIAKMWEKEIIEQAMFVNKIIPTLNKNSQPKKLQKISLSPSKEIQTLGDFVTLKSAPKSSLPRKPVVRRKTRSTSVKIKMVDNETNTSDLAVDELETYKYNIEYLQRKFNRQENEMAKLKRVNNSLKLELGNFYENYSWNLPGGTSIKTKLDYIEKENCDSNTVLPKSFEFCNDDTADENFNTKGIDSEMIITMRNCKNENFKHVSLLQVLHRTNDSVGILDDIKEPCHEKQNPVELLTKVRNAFGELVQREMNVALKVDDAPNKSEVTASFCRVNVCKSEPSCSNTVDLTALTTTSSETQFVSL